MATTVLRVGKLRQLCSDMGFKTEEREGYVEIKSKFDYWRLKEDEIGFRLYHRNTDIHKDVTDMGDYHLQTQCRDCYTVEGIVTYIDRHDKARRNRLKNRNPRKRKPSREKRKKIKRQSPNLP